MISTSTSKDCANDSTRTTADLVCLVKGKTIGIHATTLEANAALRAIVPDYANDLARCITHVERFENPPLFSRLCGLGVLRGCFVLLQRSTAALM
jgi:hypothetical protein